VAWELLLVDIWWAQCLGSALVFPAVAQQKVNQIGGVHSDRTSRSGWCACLAGTCPLLATVPRPSWLRTALWVGKLTDSRLCGEPSGKDLGRTPESENEAKSDRIDGPYVLVRAHNPKVVNSNLPPATN
jgi:hypothetical protein